MTTGQPENLLVPVRNCCVKHWQRGTLGLVVGQKPEGQSIYLQVQWGADRKTEWHPLTELRNGFRPGHTVQDSPRSNTRRSLGAGTVREVRQFAGREQVLVQFHNTGESRWIPYENLVRIRGADTKHANREAVDQDSGDRFRLKALAYALDSWNQVTGALDRLDVDPLPHQIDLVHRILTADQSNWLIADDVGLGKTIEVGLLLAAKERRRRALRVLIVCPAGMVRQWQDEMSHKFNQEFRIYGADFHVPTPSHWSNYEKVIVSIDRAKMDGHKEIFEKSGQWDAIIFDEAHHLSKIEHQAVTLRYGLAETLRGLTDAFIFLTGTPHQGNSEQFINLLKLLRPDLGRRFANSFTNPSVVAEVVLRNLKSQVTDANGNFLFRGQDTKRIEVPLFEAATDFAQQLKTYLEYGYDASAAGGNTGRAIGFVMTTYRKLASSSIAAIEGALQRRLARLQGSNPIPNNVPSPFGEDFDEDAFREGTDNRDDIDHLADIAAAPFFDDEQHQIAVLLTAAKRVNQDDQKLNHFLSEIVDPLHQAGEKLLIFTEYRATQDYLVEALEKRCSGSHVVQIHGGMDINEKRRNIAEFNEQAQFMVSTEAGGEGINLHEQCHILVNYDLPWNTSRLVQRTGRLYRYGQTERVIVINLATNDGFDNILLNKALDRLDSIVRGMSLVSPEFQYDVQQAELIGALLEQVDIASILAANRNMDLTHTDQEIEAAITRAQEAQSQQEQLFTHVQGYDPQMTIALPTFERKDVLAFLEGILQYSEVQIRNRLYDGQVLELVLPAEMRGKFPEFGGRTVVRVAVDRQLAAHRRTSDILPMDFASEFFTSLIDFAKSPEFKGEYASLSGPESGTLGLYKIRWQNDQGVPQEEELLPVFLPDGSSNEAITNPPFFGELLVKPAVNHSQEGALDSAKRSSRQKYLQERAEEELASRCTALRHPNDIVLLATADLTAG